MLLFNTNVTKPGYVKPDGILENKTDKKPVSNPVVNNNINLNNNPTLFTGKTLLFKGKAPADEISLQTLLGRYGDMSEADVEKEFDIRIKDYEEKYSYTPYDLLTLKELSGDIARKGALFMLDEGISTYIIRESLDGRKIAPETALKRYNDLNVTVGTVPNDFCADFLTADDETYRDVKDFLNQYGTASSSSVRDLIRLDKSVYKKVKNLIKTEQMPLGEAAYFAYRCDEKKADERIDRFRVLIKADKSPEAACVLAALYDPEAPETYQKALDYSNQNFDVDDSIALARLDDDTAKKALQYCDKFSISDSIKIAQSSNPELVIKLVEAGFEPDAASYFVQDNDEKTVQNKLQRINDLLSDEKGRYDAKTALMLAKLDDDEFPYARKYFDICLNAELSVKYAKDKTLTPEQRNNLEKFLNYGYFIQADGVAKALNAGELLEELEQKDEKLKEIISEKTSLNYDELTPRDKFYLILYGLDDKFYPPEQYIEKFLEYKNMTTDTGYHIFNTEHFQRKHSEDFSEMRQSLNDGMLYNNIVRALRLNPGSDEFAYFNKFLQLIKNGTLSPSSIRKLDAAFVGKDQKKAGEWVVSNNLKKDIDTYFEIKSKSSEIDFEKNLLNSLVPEFDNEQSAHEALKPGDAFQLSGEKYMRMMTPDGQSIKTRITKETYQKLFPPVSRFSTCQQVIGDCYCIESMMTMYCDETLRPLLISVFDEDDNGNLTVKFPESPYSTTYPNAQLPENQDPETFSSGADGFKLLEHAFSKHLEQTVIDNARNAIKNPTKRADFDKFINQNKNSKDGIFVYQKHGETAYTTFTEAVDKNLYKQKGKFNSSHYNSFNQYLLGQGSSEAKVLALFGLKSDVYERSIKDTPNPALARQDVMRYKDINSDIPYEGVYSYSKLKNDMTDDSFFEDNIVTVGMNDHAYSLIKEPSLTGNSYYLYNPHNQGLPIKFDDVNTLCQYLIENAKSVNATKRP